MPNERGSITPVRLLIAESSEGSAQRFDSILRDGGIATRVQLVDLPMAGDALPSADVMLCNAALPQLERLLPQLRIRAPDVPIILVDHRETTMKTAHAMRLGAADVVAGADAEQLLLVFRRELEHVTRFRRLGELHHALREAEQRCELLLQTSEAAIAYVHEGMHIHANAPYLRLFGYTDADEVLGLPLMDLLIDESAEALKVELKRFRQRGGERELAFSARSRDGGTVAGHMTLSAAQYEGESCVQVTVRAAVQAGVEAPDPTPAVAHEVANGIEPPAAASTIAAMPASTANSSVAEFLALAVRSLACPAPWMAVLVVQADQFAQLLAEQGLRNGEQIGATLEATLRAQINDAPVARIAAHQYAVVTRHLDRGGLRTLCEAVQLQFAGLQVDLGHGSVTVPVSIGAALLEADSGTPGPERVEAALDLAFAAAVRLSDAGGNRFELVGSYAESSPDSESGRTLAAINRAIDMESFRLLFQPIISLRGDASEHYEVFLRMVDADGAEVRPDDFLGTAIEHGVAGKIDRWVILRAIKALLAQRAAGHDTRLTINITANSIADPEFSSWLAVALKAARLPSDAVIFQFAERDIVTLMRQTQTFVQALRAMHCQSSLSRFGGASAPFERLKQLQVDYVKLDGQIMERMNADASGKEKVTGTLNRLQQLGKLSIVPMVETAAMLSVLWQAGANFVQGNYLQPAGPEMNFDFDPGE